ncbi:MAG TPA: DUF262 domain-containing protein [Terriglobia bacterium]|nr:DUF262 domain-containing protein [Terriglobia bacterium]
MPSELQNLDTFFNSRVFRIPDYQRGFAWGEREVADFWQDLNRLRDQRKHYVGQLTIEEVTPASWMKWEDEKWLIEGKGYKPFYVVDGQQRLTTAIVLIKCFLDAVPDGQQLAFTEKADHVKKYLLQKAGALGRAFLFGYEKDNPSYEFLKTQILEEPSVQYREIETTYTGNLAAARDYFRKQLRSTPPEVVESLFKALTQRFVFNVYELEDALDEFVVFETMNNRGKRLSKLELLKNRLIYLSTLFPAPSDGADPTVLRHNINDAWKTAYEQLGKVKGRPLDDDDFLRAHWVMYFEYARRGADQFAKSLLEDHFVAKNLTPPQAPLTIRDTQQYVSSVQVSVRKWHIINFPELSAQLPDNIRLWLERLKRLGRGAFEPLIMAALQKDVPVVELQNFLEAAERFVFVVARLCQRRADAGNNEFYRLASQLFRDKKSLGEVATIVRERTGYWFYLPKAVSDMHDLFEREAGFYSWSGLKYFLFEYEQHLRQLAGMNTQRIDWGAFTTSKKDHVTVEHIYPQSATQDPGALEWPGFKTRPKKERELLLNSLGNLLPLSQSRNSKFSNRPFEKKKKDDDGVQGYRNGSYSEIRVAQCADWTPWSVLDRGLEMLDFLEKRWGIALGSRDTKLKLLHIEFMNDSSSTTVAS